MRLSVGFRDQFFLGDPNLRWDYCLLDYCLESIFDSEIYQQNLVFRFVLSISIPFRFEPDLASPLFTDTVAYVFS